MLSAPSIRNQIWQLAAVDERQAQAMQQQLGCSAFLAQLLAERGLTAETAADFLNPSLRQLPDPLGLRDMASGLAILAEAVQKKKTIGILGDYDVDGATATALLAGYLRELGLACHYHIPNRFTEGYGPSALGLDKLLAAGAEIIMTVDCGISANDLLAEYADKCPIVIIDHHIPGPELPKAAAIINPNRLDCDFPHKNLAAVGVCFLFLIGLNRHLRNSGFFQKRAEPDLKSRLDLVALGTVADIVPLIGVNRILVKRGIEVLAMRQNIGLAALADVARLDGAPNAYHLGFVLGPRINAAGRMDEAGLGVELLLTAEGWRAKDLARRLDDFNQQRQAVEQDILAQAQAQIDAAGEDSPVLLAAHDHWHQGVIGIVASRLKDIYQKPVAVAAINADGIAVGSARSVAGFNFGNAVLAAVQSGILLGGGGHGMAAGFKIRRENLPRFADFLAARYAADVKIQDMARMVTVDAVIHPRAVGQALWADIAQLEPIGAGNPQPKLAMLHVQLTHADILKEQHLRLTLQSLDGAKVAAMAFRVMQGRLGQFLYQQRGQKIHVLGQLRPNDFNGRRSFQFLIEDAALVG